LPQNAATCHASELAPAAICRECGNLPPQTNFVKIAGGPEGEEVPWMEVKAKVGEKDEKAIDEEIEKKVKE